MRQINKQGRNEMNLKEYYKALLNEQLNEGAKEAARDAATAAKAKAARNADPAAAEDRGHSSRRRLVDWSTKVDCTPSRRSKTNTRSGRHG